MPPRPTKTCRPFRPLSLPTNLKNSCALLCAGLLFVTVAPSIHAAAPAAPSQSSVSALAQPSATSATSSSDTATEGRAQELIRALHLEPLEGESGFFGLIGRSALRVDSKGQALAAQSSIYYLLTRERPLNYLHWLASDDTHVLLEGGPVEYYIFHPDGRAELITLGHDFAAGQQLVIPVPADCWKSLRLAPGATHALMANVLSPEWTPERAQIGASEEFVTKYATDANPSWAKPEFLRTLIGPNLRPTKE
jgi:uncharacterized protein